MVVLLVVASPAPARTVLRFRGDWSSMLIRRALMVGVDIRALLLDMRLASGVSRKSAAANRIGGAYCVPAVGDAAPIGFGSLHVMCPKGSFMP